MTLTIEPRDHLRRWAMPHVLCAGCAHGIVGKAFLVGVDRAGIDPDEMVVVAGIGCSSRLVGYLDFCTLHATHGRAPAFATGIKLAKPELTVAVFSGDGDGLAIGGNHLIHAARRNLDLTVVLFNNEIYGMTGGQVAPTTTPGAKTSTTPLGDEEPPFDACKLMEGAGATFVARGSASEPFALQKIFAEALTHPGFAFVEVLSDCPTYFGRYNRLGAGPEMLTLLTRMDERVAGPLADKRVVPHLPVAEPPPGIELGILHRTERPVFTGRPGGEAR